MINSCFVQLVHFNQLRQQCQRAVLIWSIFIVLQWQISLNMQCIQTHFIKPKSVLVTYTVYEVHRNSHQNTGASTMWEILLLWYSRQVTKPHLTSAHKLRKHSHYWCSCFVWVFMMWKDTDVWLFWSFTFHLYLSVFLELVLVFPLERSKKPVTLKWAKRGLKQLLSGLCEQLAAVNNLQSFSNNLQQRDTVQRSQHATVCMYSMRACRLKLAFIGRGLVQCEATPCVVLLHECAKCEKTPTRSSLAIPYLLVFVTIINNCPAAVASHATDTLCKLL